jgi:hypothetical protein
MGNEVNISINACDCQKTNHQSANYVQFTHATKTNLPNKLTN